MLKNPEMSLTGKVQRALTKLGTFGLINEIAKSKTDPTQ